MSDDQKPSDIARVPELLALAPAEGKAFLAFNPSSPPPLAPAAAWRKRSWAGG